MSESSSTLKINRAISTYAGGSQMALICSEDKSCPLATKKKVLCYETLTHSNLMNCSRRCAMHFANSCVHVAFIFSGAFCRHLVLVWPPVLLSVIACHWSQQLCSNIIVPFYLSTANKVDKNRARSLIFYLLYLFGSERRFTEVWKGPTPMQATQTG
jgi:hypothetical protein